MKTINLFKTKTFTKFIIFICTIVITSSCEHIPIPPQAQEILNAADEKFFEQKKALNDLNAIEDVNNSELKKYVESLVKKIGTKRSINRTMYVHIADTHWVQASVVHGELINISRGMLYALQNEAQLVALLGHEVGHIVQFENEQNSEKPGLFSVVLNQVSNSEATQKQANDIIYSYYNQKRESDADEFGMLVAKDLGYEPREFVNFFNNLWKLSRSGFLSTARSLKGTHKTFQARALNLQSKLKRVPNLKKSVIGRESFLKKVSKIAPNKNSSNESALRELKQMTAELKKKSGKLSVQEFISSMQKARTLALQLGVLSQIDKSSLVGPDDHFLNEPFKLMNPTWSVSSGDIKAFQDFLNTIAHVGVGAIPVVGDAVDLYEILSGKDFISNEDLTFGERVVSSLSLLVGSGQSWRMVANAVEATGDRSVRSAMSQAAEYSNEANLFGTSKVGRTYNHYLEDGPIQPRSAVQSFSGGRYTEITPSSGETFYRIGGADGNYWSRAEPHSQMQSMSENAVLPEWNDFSTKSVLTIPRGFRGTIYEGVSANMSGLIKKNGSNVPSGSIFHGGGNQIYIPKQTIDSLQYHIQTGKL